MTSPYMSADVLDRFLRDMEALDHVQQGATGCMDSIPIHVPKKRPSERVLAPQNPTRMSCKKSRGIPSWIRTKNELQTLRQQTEALETRLQYLGMKSKLSTDAGNDVEVQNLKTKALVEKKRCQDSQQENKRLKTQLKLYKRQSQAVQTVLTRAEYQEKQLLDTSVALVNALHVEMGAGLQVQSYSTQVFDMLERRIDARLHEVQQSFEVMQKPMTSVDSDLVQTYSRNNDQGLESVEFSRLELFPFNEKAISGVLWSLAEMERAPHDERSIAVRRTEDGFALISRVTVQIERGGVVNIDSHAVLKRFMTSYGGAIMVESCSNWTCTFGNAKTRSHTTRERGCFVLRDYVSNGVPLSGICQVRSVFRLDLREQAGNSSDCSLASESTIKEVLIPSFRQLLDARYQFFQNAMFDMICARKN